MRLYIYKCYLACTVILGSVSGIFRHVWELFNTHAYLVPSVSLAYSEPWHILITKHIQTQRYIHNTILNIFSKAPSWTSDTVLNAPLSLKDAILNGAFNIVFQTYFGILKIYSVIIVLVKAYEEPWYIKEHSASEILRHILNGIF